MKSEEFLHILTRVVNSPTGPRFLELIHELREILEEAGIAEDVKPKVEPGKPIRRRDPKKVMARLGEIAAAPAATAGGAATTHTDTVHTDTVDSAGATPEGEPRPVALPADAATDVPDVTVTSPVKPGPPSGGGDEFIEAGPGRLVRRQEAPGTGGPARPEEPEQPVEGENNGEIPPEPERKKSVRAIVLSALQEGDRTTAELKDIVREQKGQVSHLSQQVSQALRKIGARKIGKIFTISTEEASPETGGESSQPSPEDPSPDDDPSGDQPSPEKKSPAVTGGVKQLNLLDEMQETPQLREREEDIQ